MNIEQADKMVGWYRYTFSSAEGEAVLKDLAKRCGVMAGGDNFQAGPAMTAEQRAYRDGQQDLYKSIEMMVQQ